MTITLPRDPTGDQYEDLISAALAVGGHFVEGQMKLRNDGQEVLELDVVASPVGGGVADRKLFEVKKEAFRFTNLFKLYGQARYLNIDRAVLVSADGCEDRRRPVYEHHAREMGLEVRHVLPHPRELAALGDPANGLTIPRWSQLCSAAWFGTIGRRVALSELRKACRDNRGVAEYESPRRYEFDSRSTFFLRTALERAEALYSAYFDNPRMSGNLVELVAARDQTEPKAVWYAAYDEPAHVPIQAVMDLEWKARLRIVKNALDDYRVRGGEAMPTTTWNLGAMSVEVPKHDLPDSFSEGLRAIANNDHGDRLPYLFQAFYLLLGGFLSLENDDDTQLLAELSGVPADEIVDSLRLIDRFFGGTKSMFRTAHGALLLKMVPAVVRGAGAFFRSNAFEIDKYEERYPKLGWLLSRWHNALYNLLVPLLLRRDEDE